MDNQPKILSLMSFSGVETTMLVEGAVDTICFDVFCQEFLRPCLKAGDAAPAGQFRSAQGKSN